jgi:hypothetical protein
MRGTLLLLASAAFTLACADTSRFAIAPDESYCGVVTGASFVRAGMKEGTRMRLQLRADLLQVAPGKIWTDPFSSGESLNGVELRVIPELLHDPLSTLSFGEGRVKNGLYIADLPPTQLTVVLSLLESGEVEVRLLRGASPGSAPDAAVSASQIFGVFRLQRDRGDCGLP